MAQFESSMRTAKKPQDLGFHEVLSLSLYKRLGYRALTKIFFCVGLPEDFSF